MIIENVNNMNWYSVFYWVTVADGVKEFFDSSSNTFTIFAILSGIAMIIFGIVRATASQESDEEEASNTDFRGFTRMYKLVSRFFYTMLILAMITWAGYVFTPSKKDALTIIAGGAVAQFVTSDTSAKQIPAEVMNLVRTKIRSEIKEINEGNKETLTDTLQTKTKEELIELLKTKQ